nr:an1-type zinc finger protein 1 [Quercus suber]
MASGNPPDQSYSTMSVGEVEAIGAHCQAAFCHQLDFLPFRCESCQGKYCLDHRTETAHACPNAGAWARKRQQALASTIKPSPRPNILTHEQQCSHPSCKQLVNTPLVTGIHCEGCRRTYCLSHRFTYDHDCDKLTPLGVQTPAAPTQLEKGLAALTRLRKWHTTKTSSNSKFSFSKSSSVASRLSATAELKKTAKGDPKVPPEKRIYLFAEASSETLSAKIPKGTFYYNVDFTVGRVLDLAAKSLQISNVNNQSSNEEDKLRVFHVEGGRLLAFSEKLGQSVATGNTIVLLRGVGADMAKSPEWN